MLSRPPLTPDQLFSHGNDYYLEHLSIDCVIFGYHDRELKVLLLQWKDTRRWCLPGGFILKKEAVDEAAVRIVASRTGLRPHRLKQFHTFGDPNRGRGEHGLKFPGNKKGSWMMERFVTIGYWALLEFSKVVPSPDELSSDCRWWNVSEVPALILDHNAIFVKALTSVQQFVNDYPIGRELLPAKFTMPELQLLYETILNKKLDRRNFQKKMLSLDILVRLDERKAGVAHKAPFLYRFNPTNYQRALKQGLKFGLI